MNMKIAIYSRKSKYSDKGDSIENQIQLCKEYALKTLTSKKVILSFSRTKAFRR